MPLANEVQIWIERAVDYPDTDELEIILDDIERGRANKFLHQTDRATFIVAHALKRKRLAEKMGVKEPSQLRFSEDETGKPYLIDADIYFNLSHSHGITALSISTTSECSVDIETHREVNQLALLIKKTMTNQETNEIEVASSPMKAFLDRWVVKEAFLKLSGIGLAEPLKSICTTSEIDSSQSKLNMLRGNALFFKRGKGYSLAAMASDRAKFSLETSAERYLVAV